ncbi:hypothetical protein ACOMHN_026687 [Nucella lapillus]
MMCLVCENGDAGPVLQTLLQIEGNARMRPIEVTPSCLASFSRDRKSMSPPFAREKKVLLITDQRNDAIHVVSIHGNTMQFERFLYGSGGPLVQPTAITVDVHDRLWVACRGGSVLMMERID